MENKEQNKTEGTSNLFQIKVANPDGDSLFKELGISDERNVEMLKQTYEKVGEYFKSSIKSTKEGVEIELSLPHMLEAVTADCRNANELYIISIVCTKAFEQYSKRHRVAAALTDLLSNIGK